MPFRGIISTGGAKDYALASLLTSGSGFMLFVEQTTPLLAWVGLLLGVLIGILRVTRNWKHWNRPPDK